MSSKYVNSEQNQDFMPLMRALVRAYQAFAAYDASGYRDIDLTVSQADVLFTLGNTDGLTFKEIGNQTLITKGTLTGVIDRMEDKGLVKRVSLSDDRRCTRVVLTAKGAKMFERVFPQQLAYIKARFDRMDTKSQQEALVHLRKIREIFS
ncbi:Transcriptional regulator, MarR family [hydrothermal vent metagenome]|uniref:Transcriptional regulator, MarR family n=1 Tax=hydrothermal vent metagenome TaxID=652676 RepID=A0A3B1A8S3_9ZZZZ